MGDCNHNGLFWFAAPATETGWKCVDCGWRPGEEPGYSPQHDRSHIRVKVESILADLFNAEIIYISNATSGDGIAAAVTHRCVAEKLFDSVSIARLILEFEGGERHVEFWRTQGEAIVAGADPRRRCHCGKLAKVHTGGKSFCTEHGLRW